MAWGAGGSLKSCNALLKRVEDNDPRLTELVILPMKTFGVADVERLSNAIASGVNTNLKSISASGHHLPSKSLKQFGHALSSQAAAVAKKTEDNNNNNTTNEEYGITSLAIGSKDMGDDGIIALCEGLEESNGGLLQDVDFGWKNLGKDGLQAIGRTFGSSNHLKQINLSRNSNIGNDGMTTFATSIVNDTASSPATTAALPSLETLILSDCNIGPSGMQSLAQVLTPSADDSIIRRAQPINITISSNPIGSEGCDTLSRLISIPRDEDEGEDGGGSSSSTLSQLFMSQCSIGDEGLVNLLKSAASTTMDTSMGHFSGLSVLDISENSITKDGVKVLAESLARSLPDLVELKLAKNELESEGVVALMKSLVTRSDKVGHSTEEEEEEEKERNATLDNLDISCTNCGIEGAKAALMSGGLTTLRLFNNRLGSDGFYAIAPLLQGGHPSIENLDLGGNNADEGAVVALLNSIADNNTGTTINEGSNFTSSLSVLEIGGNKFGNDAMEALNRLKLVFPKLDVAHDKPIQEADG